MKIRGRREYKERKDATEFTSETDISATLKT